MDTFFQYIPICEDFWSQLLSVSSSCKGKFKNLNHLCKTYATIYLHYINSELWYVSWIAHTACTKILFADSMIYPSMIGTRYNSIFAMNVLIHDMYDIKSSYLSYKISIKSNQVWELSILPTSSTVNTYILSSNVTLFNTTRHKM